MLGKAIVFPDRLQVKYLDVEIPEPTRTDVVIAVQHSWISIGTESSYYRGERVKGEQAYREGDPWPYPYAPGYQKVGVVISVGEDVADLQAGDWVFASVSRISHMFSAKGGHINPAVTDQSEVWKLPTGLPPLAYSGLVLTQVGYNCGIRPPVSAGDLAVVIGDGLVGQWAAQTLLHRGAQVIVLGRHDERLSYLPPSAAGINIRHRPIKEALAGYDGISIVVDTVGSMDSFTELQPLMKRGSHLVSAGFLGEKGLIDIQKLRNQEITLHTPSGWTRDRMNQTLQAIHEGWLQTIPLITDRYPVDQVEEAWQMITDSHRFCLGVVMDWPTVSPTCS
jgi:3-hydroxyethyl bacteriochlorophyllide a dehydrogenase